MNCNKLFYLTIFLTTLISLCSCAASILHSIAPRYQQVSTQTPPIGSCTSDSDCGQGAVCEIDEACHCKLGYLPLNNQDCQQYNCTSYQDCKSHFGYTSHLTCEDSLCQCNNSAKWFIQPLDQTCQPNTTLIGDICRVNSECGQNAYCIFDLCTCYFGYAVESNDIDCALKKCSTDQDCSPLGPHMRCTFGGKCDCEIGYTESNYLKDCEKDYNWNEMVGLYVFLALLGVTILAGVVICVTVVVKKNKRQRR